MRAYGAVVPRPAPTAAARSLLVVAVLGDVGWLLARPHLRGGANWAPLLAVLAVHAVLVGCERRWRSLGASEVFAAAAVVTVAAVALPLFGSRDLYAYAFSGRMVARYHANPYFTAPTRFRHDPLLRSIAPPWRSTKTVYGPVFTLVSVLGAFGYRTSPLLARLFFQGLEGVALLAGLRTLIARRVPTDVLVFLGLSPVVVAVVNGGHSDLLAGVLLMAGAIRLDERRTTSAGILLGAALLVKLLVAPGLLLVLSATALRRADGGRVAALRAVTIVGAMTVVGYAAVGGPGALRPLTTAGQAISRGSVWRGIRQLLLDHHPTTALSVASAQHLAGLTIGLLGLLLLWRTRRWDVAAAAGVAGILVVLLASQYVLPWYSAMALPLACVAPGRWRVLAQAQAALLMVVYVTPPGHLVRSVPGLVQVTNLAMVLEVALLVAVVAVDRVVDAHR